MSGRASAGRPNRAGEPAHGTALPITTVPPIITVPPITTVPLIRGAGSGDAEDVAEVFLAARAEMTYLPPLHSDEETRAWIAGVMLPSSQVWVAESHGRVVGFAALRGEWLDHLYLAPAAQNGGVGSALLDHAKKARPRGLDLHVFQQNTGARRFYERHGFSLVAEGDGSGNEENLPDARYRWRP
ncbi:GNAT family N-acetyltransferase [Microbispora sp. NPDC046973]|uniref:GNAT family N-acetyltransferase n=1 Tax=Microbispora sp. NPDC046973 TaxID=3155022 RepID=UPI003403AF9D